MKRLPHLLVTLLIGGCLDSPALALDVSTLVRLEYAQERGGWQKGSLDIETEVAFELGDNVGVTAIVDLVALGPDVLEPRRSDAPFVSRASRRWFAGEHIYLDVRELYLDSDISFAGLMGQVRLGKQQVVWGQADGLRLLDVVNPADFREFILPDFDDARIPLWMANVEIFLPFGDLQVLLIPDTTVNNLPPSSSTFEIAAPFAGLPTGVRVNQEPFATPAGTGDGDAGFRLSMFRGGWDITLNYLYRFDDLPVIRNHPEAGGIVLTPGYERTHMVGASFSNAFGEVVFRSELVVNTDRYFAAPVSVPSGASKSAEVAYVAGFDWTGLTDTLLSFQVFQSALTGSAMTLRDPVDTNLTLLFRHAMMNESLQLEALWIHHLNDSDNLLRFSAAWEVATNLELEFFADVFTGSRSELFGQFDDRDRVGLSLMVGL